jgi:RND family efflux transporter MFP subunit
MIITKIKTLRKSLGILVLLSILTGACAKEEEQVTAPRAIPVQLQTVTTGTIADTTDFVGTLKAEQRVSLAPKINGRILQILAREGDTVIAGSPIVQLEPIQDQENFNAAVANINAQRANLQLTEANFRTAQAETARARAEVERARANLEDIKAEVELAQINLKRSKALVEGGALPQQDLDDKTRDLKSRLARQAAQQEALNATIRSVQASEERERQALASIDSQRAIVSQSEAQANSTGQTLAFNRVVAPITGVVDSFPIRVGDFVRAGDELTSIIKNDVLDLNLNIPIGNLSKLRLGIPVEIINADGSAGPRGQISFISPSVDQQAQAILAKASFPNRDGKLKNDQFVRVRVIWDQAPGIIVPTISISRVGAQNFVFVAEQNDSGLVAKQKPVQLGTIQGQNYHVISGLNAGEKIAVSGILNLRNDVLIVSEDMIKRQ